MRVGSGAARLGGEREKGRERRQTRQRRKLTVEELHGTRIGQGTEAGFRNQKQRESARPSLRGLTLSWQAGLASA